MKALARVFGLVLAVVMAMQINNAYAERQVINNVSHIHQVESMNETEFLGHNACGPTSACMIVEFHKVQPALNSSYNGWYVWNKYADFTDKSGQDYNGYDHENVYQEDEWAMDMDKDENHEHSVCGAHGFIIEYSIVEGEDYWGTAPDYLETYLQNHGLIVNQIGADFNLIKQNIDAGLPLIGHWPGHYLVVIGYDTGEDNDKQKLVMHDPYGDRTGVYDATKGYWPGGASVTYNFPTVKTDITFDKFWTVHPVGVYFYFPGYRNRATLSLQQEDDIPQPSKPFVDCYNNNGGKDSLGIPWDNGKGVWVHHWPDGSSNEDTIFLQDFIRPDGKWHQLVLNQEMKKVFPVHGQILSFWHDYFGYQNYGEPTGNEYYATHSTNNHKLVVQNFKKNGVVRYIGYDTEGGVGTVPREYSSSEFFVGNNGGFYPYQIINGEFYDAESFVINGETYFVTTYINDFGSKIYKWNGSLFTEFQSISVNWVYNWESFSINDEVYLMGSDFSGDDSKIYKWNGFSFVKFQSIPYIAAWDLESFSINGEIYFVVANYNDDSKIYKWNSFSFTEVQSIPTNGALDWENFLINGENYLVVVNYNDDSKIYKWNGSLFEEFQSIPANGVSDWESFSINGKTYLIAAHYYNNNSDSKIYKWNGFSFIEFQTIPTNGAWSWKSFSINGKIYLAVTNRNADMVIYTFSDQLVHQEQMTIRQDEIVCIDFYIPANCAQSTVSRIIEGSDVEMSLISPDGTVIDRDTQDTNVYHALGATYEVYKVNNPMPGEWTVRLIGTDVPAEGEATNLTISVNNGAVSNQHPVANAGPDQTVAVNTNCMASVNLDGSASSDPDGDPLTYSWTWDSGSTTGMNPIIQLPLGITTITLVVNDGTVDSNHDTVDITVVDDTRPEITLSVSPDTLWPPNHKMVLITPAITVSDNCDSDPVIELQLITMNEGEETNTYDPGYDSTIGDGNTVDDIQIDENGNIYLRSERSGTGDGRIYTITYSATDASGNTSTASATVTVPHNQ